jgi:aspartate-semialdehyde dehydrogenase
LTTPPLHNFSTTCVPVSHQASIIKQILLEQLKMAKIAVLGGTGNVGRTVVDVLKEHPEHSVIVLGRKVCSSPRSNGTRGVNLLIMTQAPEKQDPEAPVFVVDYTNVDVLLALFEEHQIDTVISCLRIDSEEMAAAQSNSITAADKSKTTKRFLASNWAPPIADP